MTDPDDACAETGTLGSLLRPIFVALAFLTRISVPHRRPVIPSDLAKAHLAFPLIGTAIGAAVATCYWMLITAGVPGSAAAAAALAIGVLITGGLHEDGLADTCDGLGGGRDRAAKLQIMRDSRIGSYGAIALVLSLLARTGALAAMSGPVAFASLVVAHSLSRTAATSAAALVPAARRDGLATVARPTRWVAVISIVLSAIIAILILPIITAAAVIAASTLSAIILSRTAFRQVGGQTGDILGAIQQIAETGILMVCAAAA